MANRRPRLSGIACLQCESRLLQPAASRPFSRLAAPSRPPSAVRPSAGSASLQIRNRVPNAARQLHSGISLRAKASAKTSSASAGDGDGNGDGDGVDGSKDSPSHPLSDLVVDEVLLEDGLLGDPLLDEEVSQAAAEQIWNSLLGDEGEPTEREIISHVDELQPVDDKILPQSVYEDLARHLSDGFTTAQLLSYVRKKRKTTTPPTVYPWEVRRRPWVPDTPGGNPSRMFGNNKNATGDGSDGRAVSKPKVKAVGPGSALLLQGYINSSMTNKEKVVAQLMRECWGVSVSEVMESPGKLVVEVRDIEYSLLEVGAQSWLRDISTAFSSVTTTTATASRSSNRSTSKGQSRHSRRIELSPEKRVLRIFAPSSVADAMMAEIHRVLQTTTTRRFSLADVTRPGVTISNDALMAVGALTSSAVRLSGENSTSSKQTKTRLAKAKVTVSWVTPHRPSGEKAAVEDTGDVVFRLLLHTFGPSAADAAPVTAKIVKDGHTQDLDYTPMRQSKGRFLASENSSIHRAKLGWYDRLSKWARWIEPTPDARSLTVARVAKAEPDARALPFDFTFAAAARAPAQGQKWYETVQTSTAAVLGHVLHKQDHGAKTCVYGADGTVPPSEPAQRVPDVRRVLSAVTPPLLGMDLVGAGAAGAEFTPSTTVVLRLLPDTGTGKAGAGAPAIEVIMDASAEEGATPVLAAVRAVTATSVCDTLFPTQSVDARTTQQQFYELRAADINASSSSSSATPRPMAPLLAFLEQSNLQLHGNSSSEFIATPLRVHGLGLPRATFLKTVAGSEAGSEDEIVYVDYLFAGAEVRRRVATAFQGWTVGLTDVQSGSGQGRWTELSLEAVPAGAFPAGGEHTKDSFRQAVGALVHGDTIKWQMPLGEVLC